ncbi:MAG: hypothetical protein HY841_08795 [Bacteroidetes bacterium]|nr:hypothetical protein [Bacteroidota bacterium]
MKSFKHFLLATSFPLFLSSCGVHQAVITNVAATNTNVELSKKNFKVTDKVAGTSSAVYVFGIGGISNKALIERAKLNMFSNANLIGSSKALINLSIETHFTYVYLFFFKKTITVSGYVIEFTE